MNPIKLSDDLRARIIRRLTERVNEARHACGWLPLAELDPAQPGAICGCLLAENLTGYALVDDVRVVALEDARSIADRWGTTLRSTHEFGYLVQLPRDVQLGARAFDAGLLPELIDEDQGTEYSSASVREVAEEIIAADCEAGLYRYPEDDINQEVPA